MKQLTILICTHNRSELLRKVLASLNAAEHPGNDWQVTILVAANACGDGTIQLLTNYRDIQLDTHLLPLEFIEVPTPGKSHALNAAIPLIKSELTAFVDDDHRVAPDYLVAIAEAVTAWPEAGLYCGKILPDWVGTEPNWVHDQGPYRIYPLPVPRYDQGDEPRNILLEQGPLPGGGNLVARLSVFELAGLFSTELGPQGHDLGGGEDTEYVARLLSRGVRCLYVPQIVQYHYVDIQRLKLGYMIRKAFQRTRSISRVHGHGRVPMYMWRKLTGYTGRGLFSLSWARTRFYMIRTAAAWGEILGSAESGNRKTSPKLASISATYYPNVLGLLTLFILGMGTMIYPYAWEIGLWNAMGVAGVCTIGLIAKSLKDFSQTGPRIRQGIISRYRLYTRLAFIRLTIWSFIIMVFLAMNGVVVYAICATSFGLSQGITESIFSALVGLAFGISLQFLLKLRHNPGLIVASMHYRPSRLYQLWNVATSSRLTGSIMVVACVITAMAVISTISLVGQSRLADAVGLWAWILFTVTVMAWCVLDPPGGAKIQSHTSKKKNKPNILMIGSDTLRVDRLGCMGYKRNLTPNIDRLAQLGSFFTNCYVPCARTAPSLVSLFTGTWPHTHGIRDNFVSDDDTRLHTLSLATLLKHTGYRSATISDWCGADLGKFSLGFDYTDLPEDQWNLKYLIRQGPKDIRLFLSLFLHNRLGRLFLPELYYLGGVPLTQQMGRRARRLLSSMAEDDKPFLLNVFYSTTHPPFASEWPWYTRYADPSYTGESKFAMARLTEPFDIIRRQGEPKEEFDLDQIIDLYDGCVAEFDDEVGKMLSHLSACGLAENTIVVIYSDHGMEFFEHDTWGQGNSAVGEASPRIPLVIRDPRKPARGRIDEVVRSIDLAPTLLELTGSPIAASMEGVSLAGCLEKDSPCQGLTALNETGIWITDIPGLPEDHLRYPDLLDLIDVPNRDSGTLSIKAQYQQITLNAKDRMLREGRWKLVCQPLRTGYALKLFDLEQDPSCNMNISTQLPELTLELWKKLRTMAQLPDGNVHVDCAVSK